jgi:hypothetical protein
MPEDRGHYEEDRVWALKGKESVHVQPGQGSRATKAPNVQGLKLAQSLVEPSGEMNFVSGNLPQGLLVWHKALNGA